MALVYTNALFTISAVRSASGDGGCFSTNREFYTSGISPDESPYTLVARKKIEHWHTLHTPLLTRGWVFQERILSPRVVHFGEQEAFWECLSRMTCQCTGIEDASIEREELQESDIGAKKHKYTTFLTASTTNTASAEMSRHEITIKWQTMVRDFSDLKLTKATDRLPALSGLRSRFGDLKSSMYLQGLWQDTIHSDMLWYQNDSRTAHINMAAPTWSWAYVGGFVNFFEYNYSTCETWNRKKMKRFFGCIDGEVQDGQLTLRWRTPYDLVPAYLDDVRSQGRRRHSELRTPDRVSNDDDRNLVLSIESLRSGMDLGHASVDEQPDNTAHDSDQTSAYSFPSGPCSINTDDDDQSVHNPGFHNASTYLSFRTKVDCTRCLGTGILHNDEPTNITKEDICDLSDGFVRCTSCRGSGSVDKDTMSSNYVSNFFEDWNLHDAEVGSTRGSEVACLLLAEASSDTWLFVVLEDLGNGTHRRIGTLEAFTVHDPSLTQTGLTPFPFVELEEGKVLQIV